MGQVHYHLLLRMFIYCGFFFKRCLEIAQQLSPEMVSKYAGLYANQLVEGRRFGDAIEAFAKYGSNNVPLPNNIPIYPC